MWSGSKKSLAVEYSPPQMYHPETPSTGLTRRAFNGSSDKVASAIPTFSI